MGVVVKCPFTMHVDNDGAILLLDSISASQRANHIDVHYHFIWYCFDGRTVENKNSVQKKIFQIHLQITKVMKYFTHLHQSTVTVSVDLKILHHDFNHYKAKHCEIIQG